MTFSLILRHRERDMTCSLDAAASLAGAALSCHAYAHAACRLQVQAPMSGCTSVPAGSRSCDCGSKFVCAMHGRDMQSAASAAEPARRPLGERPRWAGGM